MNWFEELNLKYCEADIFNTYYYTSKEPNWRGHIHIYSNFIYDFPNEISYEGMLSLIDDRIEALDHEQQGK